MLGWRRARPQTVVAEPGLRRKQWNPAAALALTLGPGAATAAVRGTTETTVCGAPTSLPDLLYKVAKETAFYDLLSMVVVVVLPV